MASLPLPLSSFLSFLPASLWPPPRRLRSRDRRDKAPKVRNPQPRWEVGRGGRRFLRGPREEEEEEGDFEFQLMAVSLVSTMRGAGSLASLKPGGRKPEWGQL